MRVHTKIISFDIYPYQICWI